jgi:hypothetical protein
MDWTNKLEVILIKIMRRYIKGRKLADNVFRKEDHVAIAIKM